jgi:DNA-binding NarL/FixJ family response regulator
LEVERYRSYDAIRTALSTLADASPLLLVLDDVQWADPASLELIAHLLRRGVGRTMLVLAYRSGQAPRSLAEAEASAAAARVELAPFTADEARRLLGADVDASRMITLFRESGGNPFYLEHLARDTTDEHRRERREQGVPAALALAVAREVENQSSAAKQFVNAAAIVGDPFDPQIVADVARVDPDQAAAAIRELMNVDLVRATSSGRLVFRHPIVRRAVYEAAGPGTRVAAHRRAASVLGARGGPIGARANHLAQSASYGDLDAIAVLREAGHAAAARAPAAAAHWLTAANRLLPKEADSGERLDMLLSLASALVSTGRVRDARSVVRDAVALVPVSAPSAHARVITILARIEQQLGRTSEARLLLDEALEATPPATRDAVVLMIELAHNDFVRGEWLDAVSRCADARGLAAELGDRALYLAATTLAAQPLQYVGRFDEAFDAIEEAARSLDEIADEDMTPHLLEALGNLAFAELNVTRWDAGARHGERGTRACRATGQSERFVALQVAVAVGGLFQGRLAEAREAAESAVEAALLFENDQSIALAGALRCWVATMEGSFQAALHFGELANRTGARVPGSAYAWIARFAYGEALVASGEPERGRDHLLSAGGHEMAGAPPVTRMYFLRALAEAEIAAGQIAAAEAAAVRLAALDVEFGMPFGRGQTDHARANVHFARGAAHDAARSAATAVEFLEQSEALLESARARLTWGRALAQAGERDAASRELEAARAAFVSFGAQGLAEQAADALRGLGKRVRRARSGAAPESPGGLTPRELEVAALVAQGNTNRQIAAQLNLSEKTVQKHLENSSAKLDVSSRTAVAFALERWRAEQ